jgi:GNAT superfamily N-acetyltransferase
LPGGSVAPGRRIGAEMVAIRWSAQGDEFDLAALHGEAWAYAYAGIIPGLALARMTARRGPKWWRQMQASGGRTLVAECGDLLAGYAMLGACRMRGRSACGEIYELYLRPECQGIGFGRRLFDASRTELRGHGLSGLVIWSLARNEIGCRFYRAVGGREFARARERIGGVELEKIGFGWS